MLVVGGYVNARGIDFECRLHILKNINSYNYMMSKILLTFTLFVSIILKKFHL